MVGAIGFEPMTPCSRSRCATRLRYAPNSPKVKCRLDGAIPVDPRRERAGIRKTGSIEFSRDHGTEKRERFQPRCPNGLRRRSANPDRTLEVTKQQWCSTISVPIQIDLSLI